MSQVKLDTGPVAASWWVDGKRGTATLYAALGSHPEAAERLPDIGLFVGLPTVLLPAELPPTALFVQSLGIVPGVMFQRDPAQILWGVARVHGDEESPSFDVLTGRLEGGLSSFARPAIENALQMGLAVIDRRWPAWPIQRVVLRAIDLVVERPARPPAPLVPEA